MTSQNSRFGQYKKLWISCFPTDFFFLPECVQKGKSGVKSTFLNFAIVVTQISNESHRQLEKILRNFMADIVQETHRVLRNSLLKNVSRTFGSTMYAIPLFLLRLLFDVTVQVLWTNSLSANQCILQATPLKK